MVLKRENLVCSFSLLLVLLFAFYNSPQAQEVVERYRLGNVIEDITYINTGELAGKVAFVDGWDVYTLDLDTGDYNKIFYYGDYALEDPSAGFWTSNGISYISSGDFSGNFLLNISGIPDLRTFLIISPSGSLVSKVTAVDFEWRNSAEGITEITSGSYRGNFAMIINRSHPHICIFCLEQEGGIVNAQLIKEIFFEDRHARSGICFFDDTYPDTAYKNHFLLMNAGGRMDIFDDYGNIKRTFPGDDNYHYEGLAYINNGTYQGKVMVNDSFAQATWLGHLGGNNKIYYTNLLGVGFHGIAIWLKWISSTEQFLIGDPWYGHYWLVSRMGLGSWITDKKFKYSGTLRNFDVSELTNDSKFYILVIIGYELVDIEGQYRRLPLYGIQKLDSSFNIEATFQLPREYLGKMFWSILYIPGETPFNDKFALLQARDYISNTSEAIVYLFDKNFNYPATIIDISEEIERFFSGGCYDPIKERYYLLDRGMLLHVFDSFWNLLAEIDLSPLVPQYFYAVAKITTGDLEGNIALVNRPNSEIFIVNVENQIVSSQLEKLIEEAQNSEIHQGIKTSLLKKLEIAKSSFDKGKIIVAIHQISAFQSEVQAQSGKKIPIELANRWIVLADDIIRSLDDL